MCLAVPGRVVAISGMTARVDFSGVERDVCLDLLPETGIGEYVLVHAGFAIQRMDAAEASEVILLFEQLRGPEEA